MYLVVVYDLKEKRVHKIHRFLKTKLFWVQNSVFEGELSKSEKYELEQGVKNIINSEEDSVIIYSLGSKKWTDREVIGREQKKTSNFI